MTKNKLTINQRGASLTIDNTTDKESIALSQRSGSNLQINNHVNSELATNNKQTNIVNDSFETVGNDRSVFIGGNEINRVVGSSQSYKGIANEEEYELFKRWKEEYDEIAKLKGRFKIKRGGSSVPNGETTVAKGTRAINPVLSSKVYTVENFFSGYTGTPIVKKDDDEVTAYVKVANRSSKIASEKDISLDDLVKSAGASGSEAPGVMETGGYYSSSTEGGSWEPDEDALYIADHILEKQPILNLIESEIGNGGDNTEFVKRDNFKQTGTVFNDYPSIKIDPKGRSQPMEVLVSDKGNYKNHDYLPHVENVDNSSNFPGGNDTEVICNHKNTLIGSGGWNCKSSGPIEIGGSTVLIGGQKTHITGAKGIHIGSESGIELQSVKSITLRTNRQVFVENSLGVKNNAIIGGGISVEGEAYLQHVTAPLEVQQTEDTTLFGQFATETDRTLLIGETLVGGNWYPTYAKATPDLLLNYPHSHHFNNLPLRLTTSNSDVRKFAQAEQINKHGVSVQSLPQLHEKKNPVQAVD